ncbi:MAG: hypothetical protein ABI877_07105 [Gemmatimonadaceae bacterium]
MATDSDDLAGLLKLAKSIMLDGTVTRDEADYLREWVRSHPDLITRFPGKDVCAILERILVEGALRNHEREELSALLEQLPE